MLNYQLPKYAQTGSSGVGFAQSTKHSEKVIETWKYLTITVFMKIEQSPVKAYARKCELHGFIKSWQSKEN